MEWFKSIIRWRTLPVSPIYLVRTSLITLITQVSSPFYRTCRVDSHFRYYRLRTVIPGPLTRLSVLGSLDSVRGVTPTPQRLVHWVYGILPLTSNSSLTAHALDNGVITAYQPSGNFATGEVLFAPSATPGSRSLNVEFSIGVMPVPFLVFWVHVSAVNAAVIDLSNSAGRVQCLVRIKSRTIMLHHRRRCLD